MKTVVTSRPEKRILNMIEHSQSSQLNLSPLIQKSNKDIKPFVQRRLQGSKYLRSLEGLHARIEEKLVAKTDVSISLKPQLSNRPLQVPRAHSNDLL